MSYFLNPNKTDARILIILLLSGKYPLTAKQIHREIKEKERVSYQYIHKVLLSLRKDMILSYENKAYSLNIEWIQRIKNFINDVDDNYKLDYKMLERRINAEVIQFLDKDEREHLIKDMNEMISHRTTHKLDEWYSRFYDPEDKEFRHIRSVANLKGKKILEIGCGTGRLTRRLLKYSHDVISIDVNEECIKYCKDHYKNGKFLFLDVRDLEKLSPRKFDVIISGWIGLHHFDDKDQTDTLNTIKSLLKKQGKLILIEAYHNTEYVTILNILFGSKDSISERNLHLKEKLVDMFENVNETVIMTEYVFPSFEEVETTFKFEVQYEYGITWNKKHRQKLMDFLDEKEKKLVISEAPVCFLCT